MNSKRPYTNTDLYKLTMKQFVWRLFPNAWVKYHYKLRSKGVDLLPFKDAIQQKVDALHGVGPNAFDMEFFKMQDYFDPAFLVALSHFKLNTDFITISEKDGRFDLVIEGPWYDTIDFEVHLLQIISETYFEQYALDNPDVYVEGRRRLDEKCEHLLRIYDKQEALKKSGARIADFRLSEFGTRRAFSADWQGEVVDTLASRLPKTMLAGTSNVHLAAVCGLTPQGTMAHELISAMVALYPLNIAQRMAFYHWNEVYKGKLGIALSDTFTFDQFLRDFDLALANLFAGARHDSGDPFTWGTKLIAHYAKHGIDSFSKQAVWSDNLNLDKSESLWEHFRSEIKTVFGIGTFLTNDMGVPALSQVIKMTHLNGLPLIKISDEPEKVMCEDEPFKDWAVHYFTEVAPKLV